MDDKIRAFISFDINDKFVLKNIRNIQHNLFETEANLRMVETDNIHITLRFLGNVEAEIVQDVVKVMDSVNFKTLNTEIRGVGIFPNMKYIRIIWAGVKNSLTFFEDIFSQFETNLRNLGFKPERKNLSPHITIARVRTAKNKKDLMLCVKKLEDYYFGTIKFDKLRLKKSTLTSKGPIYETIHEVAAK